MAPTVEKQAVGLLGRQLVLTKGRLHTKILAGAA